MSWDSIRLQPCAVILKPRQCPWLPDSLLAHLPLFTARILLHWLEKRRLMLQQPWWRCLLHFIRSDLQSHFRNPFRYGGHQSSWSLRLLCRMCSGNPRWSWQYLFIGQASVLHLGSIMEEFKPHLVWSSVDSGGLNYTSSNGAVTSSAHTLAECPFQRQKKSSN